MFVRCCVSQVVLNMHVHGVALLVVGLAFLSSTAAQLQHASCIDLEKTSCPGADNCFGPCGDAQEIDVVCDRPGPITLTYRVPQGHCTGVRVSVRQSSTEMGTTEMGGTFGGVSYEPLEASFVGPFTSSGLTTFQLSAEIYPHEHGTCGTGPDTSTCGYSGRVCAYCSPVAHIDNVAIRGVNEDPRGLTADLVEVFHAVPYAEHTKRFERAKLQADYSNSDSINATEVGRSCPQVTSPEHNPYFHDLGEVDVDERKCNWVDIYRPRGTTSESGKAVLVWIHGGGFAMGSPAQPSNQMHSLVQSGDLVVVCVSYRLGLFGFQQVTGVDGTVSDDSGLWGFIDQRMALWWVKKYIANFGGDPNRITIAGESAGGTSVCYHLALESLRSKADVTFLDPAQEFLDGTARLFNRAVIASAACHRHQFYDRQKQKNREEKMEHNKLDFKNASAEDILKRLRELDLSPEDLADWYPPGTVFQKIVGGGKDLGEGWWDFWADPTFIPKDIAVLYSVTRDEFGFLMSDSSGETFETMITSLNNLSVSKKAGLVAADVFFLWNDAVIEALATELNIPIDNEEGRRIAVREIGSSLWLVCPTIFGASFMGAQTEVYFETLQHQPPHLTEASLEKGSVARLQGAMHGTDLTYLFQNAPFWIWRDFNEGELFGDDIGSYDDVIALKDDKEVQVANSMRGSLIQFVETGFPLEIADAQGNDWHGHVADESERLAYEGKLTQCKSLIQEITSLTTDEARMPTLSRLGLWNPELFGSSARGIVGPSVSLTQSFLIPFSTCEDGTYQECAGMSADCVRVREEVALCDLDIIGPTALLEVNINVLNLESEFSDVQFRIDVIPVNDTEVVASAILGPFGEEEEQRWSVELETRIGFVGRVTAINENESAVLRSWNASICMACNLAVTASDGPATTSRYFVSSGSMVQMSWGLLVLVGLVLASFVYG